MKLGTMKAMLPWALEEADLVLLPQRRAAAGTRPRRWHRWVTRHTCATTIDSLVAEVTAAARSGDHIVCMSNGGFGGVHGKLLDALRRRPA